MRPSPDTQLAVGPMELTGSEQPGMSLRHAPHEAVSADPRRAPLNNSELHGDGLSDSEQLAARVLDEAFRTAGLDNKEIAHLCGISVSLVDKWRRTDQRGCPSVAQMLRLPPAFPVALHRVLNRRYGFGRAALGRALDALGDLAFAGDL